MHDREMREPLFEYLEEQLGKVRILEEKTIGRARADVMIVLSSEIWGLEIKSDADSYTRLANQVREYDRYFDRNVVAVGSTHAMHIREHVPEYWGIISVEYVDGAWDFYLMQKPQPNPHRSMKRKMSFLWRPELADIQQKYGMPAYRQKSKLFVRNKILETVPEDVLQKTISAELFERDYTKISEEIASYRSSHGRKRRR